MQAYCFEKKRSGGVIPRSSERVTTRLCRLRTAVFPGLKNPMVLILQGECYPCSPLHKTPGSREASITSLLFAEFWEPGTFYSSLRKCREVLSSTETADAGRWWGWDGYQHRCPMVQAGASFVPRLNYGHLNIHVGSTNTSVCSSSFIG